MSNKINNINKLFVAFSINIQKDIYYAFGIKHFLHIEKIIRDINTDI